MYKNFNLTTYALGLVGLFVTVYVARKAWEKAGEGSEDSVGFNAKK